MKTALRVNQLKKLTASTRRLNKSRSRFRQAAATVSLDPMERENPLL
ncbi:hypothetical protein ERICII_01425 [Paenibacillus larvae subsp. larvae DSM 25430]|nr:hypothetical protein ERICII_01425 [Paenibacillus larvae subsp. larvae DSM 25430]